MKTIVSLLGFFVSVNALGNTSEFSQAIVVREVKTPEVIVKIMENKDGKWVQVGEQMKGVIGKGGFATAGEKKEGDKKTPTGIFEIVSGFGVIPPPTVHFPYRVSKEEDKWIDDPMHDDYNNLVSGPTKAKSFEKMIRKDGLYDLGLVLNYNLNPVVKGKGSAIFIHIWRSPKSGTAGCVAISKENLFKIFAWLDPKKNPVAVLNQEL